MGFVAGAGGIMSSDKVVKEEIIEEVERLELEFEYMGNTDRFRAVINILFRILSLIRVSDEE
jgi:hypothetical protein